MAEAKYLNHPEASRLFVQEGVGLPWVWVGCVTVNGIQLEPRQLAYARCVDENGVTVSTIPRNPDPAPFDIAFNGNWAKWQSLHRSITRNGCLPNMFMANAECRDREHITDPTYNNNGVMLYGTDLSSAYSFHNSTAVFRDANQAVEREDKMSFVFGKFAWVRDFEYGLQAAITSGAPASSVIDSFAVVDSGSCADYVCQSCDAEGCQDVLMNDGTNFFFSLNAGSTWTQIVGSGAGKAQAFNENAFAVKASEIRTYAGLDSGASVWADWTTAVTDVAFDELSNITDIDPRTLLVGGEDGAVWRSNNSGGNWVQIRAASPTTVGWYDFMAMDYNKETKVVVAVVKDGATQAIYIQMSIDRGKSWTTIGATTGNWAGGSVAVVYNAGNLSYVLIDGEVYKVSCLNGLQSHTKMTITGASGNITGIGGVDESNGNSIFLTVFDTIGKVVRTIDGFNTWTIQTLPFSIATGDSAANPIAVCNSKYGESLWMAFDDTIYWGRDWDSFFADA